MYTIQEVTESVIKIAEATPSMKVTYFPRKKRYQIKFKSKGRYTTGWECFNQVKFLYETTNLQKINWDYFIYQVFDKHIEIPNSYKFI